MLTAVVALGGLGVVPPAGGVQCASHTYDGFTSADGDAETGTLRINGNAAVVGSRIRVTPATFSQAGSVFTTQKLDLASDGSFSSYFRFQFEALGGGADGLVFVVQNVANNVGSGGGGIGYLGLQPSIGIELDNWSNHFDQNQDPREPDENHIGININGSILSDPVAPSALLPGIMDNGGIWHSWVDYNGVTNDLEVRAAVQVGDVAPERPAAALLSKNIDLPVILGGDGAPVSDAFAGFTSGTGGAHGNHDVLYWQINQCFDPIGALSVEAGGPYVGVEGSPRSLVGSVSGSTGPVTTAWSYAITSAHPATACTIAQPSNLATALSCSDNGTFAVSLEATDTNGTEDDSASVTFANAKPGLAVSSPPADGLFTTVGETIQVMGSINDPGANDTHTCTITWGSGTSGTQPAQRRACAPVLTFTSPGVYRLKLTAADDDGGISAAVMRTVTVCSNDITSAATTITGTAGADVLCGTNASDSIVAGGGNDLVLARGGNDVVSGGPGSDRLHGAAGVDRLTGGADKDRLFGEAGNDVLNACGDGVGDMVNGGTGTDLARRVSGQDTLSSVETRRPC